MTTAFKRTLILMLGSATAVLLAMTPLPAAFDGQHFIPVGNDSFYHARRILDAVADPSGYYEFDPKIHAPEGSLLTWPWAYDLGYAWLVRAGLAAGISADPMKIMDYVPVAAVPLAVALMLLIAVQLRLSAWGQALAVGCMAVSPLTQFLFMVGMIDHHDVEYLFVLAALAASLAWLTRPERARRAALAGVVLGSASAFQNGLFILQLPLLACIALLWLRAELLPRRSALVFGTALVGSCLAMLLPSQPFRAGYFSYYLFSWFHLYIAASTAVLVGLLAWRPPSPRAWALLGGTSLALLVPLAGQIVLGGHYFGAPLEMSLQIGEVRSVPGMLQQYGLRTTLAYYSALLLAAPFALAGCLAYLLRQGSDRRLTILCVFSVFGLVLLLSKYRLENFGSFALFLPLLVAADHAARARPRQARRIMLAVTVLCLAAQIPSATKLFSRPWPGKDMNYALTLEMYPEMRAICARAPGLMLANSDDGHYIRFHTECSVLANNFMLTRQHAEKIEELLRLQQLQPAALLREPLPVRYVFARLGLVMATDAGRTKLADLATQQRFNPPLVNRLLFTPAERIDPHFRLLKELRFPGPGGFVYARLFELGRDDGTAGR